MSDFEKRLRGNMVDLQKSMTVGEDIMAHLMQDGILNWDDCEEIREERTTKKKIVKLLNILPRKGPNAEGSFISALNNSSQSHVAEILIGAGAGSGAGPVARPNPVRKPQPVITMTGNNEVDASHPLISFRLKSTPREVAMENNRHRRNYPMTRKPRGRAIILNIVHYDGLPGKPEKKETRTGADIDEENMKNLLNQLYFTVEIWRDIKHVETLNAKLKEEKEHEDHKKSNAFIFVMMAHGEKDHIYLDRRVEIEHIVGKFLGTKCENLVGKPKIFFIQACQGEKETVGLTAADGPLEGGETQADALAENLPSPKKISHMKDMFIAYATCPGFRAYRNTVHGSWFVRSIVKVFAESVHERSLNDLMTEVAGIVSEERDENGYLQTCRNISTCDKHLYFLPGYHE